MKPPSTKDRILDAAEELFASQGYDATSLRGLTQAAEVNLAAVNYHFGSKRKLFQAVFERRVGPINRERLALLEAREDRGPEPPSVEELLQILIGPALRLRAGGGQGSRRFLELGDDRVDLLGPELESHHAGQREVEDTTGFAGGVS